MHPDGNTMCDELSYLVTCQEISLLSLHAKLVVLSCGQECVWRGLDDIHLPHYLANAFLKAGKILMSDFALTVIVFFIFLKIYISVHKKCVNFLLRLNKCKGKRCR